MLVLGHPAFDDSDGRDKSGTVTATLALVPGGPAFGSPQSFTLTPFRPPGGVVALRSDAPAG